MLLLSTASAGAASFECSKAEAPDEKTICANPTLNDADVRMTTMFEMETDLVAMGERDTLRGTQKKWLARRSACKDDVPCLTAAYDQRLLDLQKIFKDIVSRGPK
jgi:uncharacterized protein